MKGGDWWKEYQGERNEEQNKMEKGVFKLGGMCRNAAGQKNRGLYLF